MVKFISVKCTSADPRINISNHRSSATYEIRYFFSQILALPTEEKVVRAPGFKFSHAAVKYQFLFKSDRRQNFLAVYTTIHPNRDDRIHHRSRKNQAGSTGVYRSEDLHRQNDSAE